MYQTKSSAQGYLYCRSSRESFCEADHTHVVCILLQAAGVLIAAMQAWQTGLLVLDSSAGVSAGMSLTAGQLCIFLRESTGKEMLMLRKYD